MQSSKFDPKCPLIELQKNVVIPSGALFVTNINNHHVKEDIRDLLEISLCFRGYIFLASLAFGSKSQSSLIHPTLRANRLLKASKDFVDVHYKPKTEKKSQELQMLSRSLSLSTSVY